MRPVGRRRTLHKGLPPRLYLKRGRYYYGRNQEFVGDNLADAMLAYGEREAARAGRRPITFGDLALQYVASEPFGRRRRGRARATWTSSPCCSRCSTRRRSVRDRAAPHRRLPRQPHRPAAQGPQGRAAAGDDASQSGNRPFLDRLELGPGYRPANLPNPCPGVKRNKETGRDRYVTDEELQAVWEAADEPLRDALDLYHLTGQRVSDVLRMSLTDVREGCLHLRQRKTGKALRLAVEGDLSAVLDRIKGRQFPERAVVSLALVRDENGQRMTYDALSDRFQAARARAGVHFQLRDLRAKAATDLGGLGACSKAAGALVPGDDRALHEAPRIGEKVRPLLRTRSRIADKKNGPE
jgi:integrase